MICIIGGGPSGMMAAWSAKKHHPQETIILIERNEVLGKKMRLTGGGRCNVTANVAIADVVQNVPKNGKFLYSALDCFGPNEIIEFFHNHGITLKEEDHHRMFPSTDKSSDIVEALESALIQSGVEIRYGVTVTNIDESYIYTETDKFAYNHCILATGGKTFPKTGSDGTGYTFAQYFGHTITALYPQEVPLVSNDAIIQEKTLQGLSFRDIQLRVKSGKKTLATLTHDLIFTHFGLSGPAALRASFYVQKELEKTGMPVTLEVDFIPGSTEVPEQHENMPKRLVETLLKRSEPLIENLKRFRITVYDTRGFNYAFVTNGGVSIKEVDPKTCRSKLSNTLSLCGEVLDVSAFTGGYNITSCLTTGYTAGKYCID